MGHERTVDWDLAKTFARTPTRNGPDELNLSSEWHLRENLQDEHKTTRHKSQTMQRFGSRRICQSSGEKRHEGRGRLLRPGADVERVPKLHGDRVGAEDEEKGGEYPQPTSTTLGPPRESGTTVLMCPIRTSTSGLRSPGSADV